MYTVGYEIVLLRRDGFLLFPEPDHSSIERQTTATNNPGFDRIVYRILVNTYSAVTLQPL